MRVSSVHATCGLDHGASLVPLTLYANGPAGAAQVTRITPLRVFWGRAATPVATRKGP